MSSVSLQCLPSDFKTPPIGHKRPPPPRLPQEVHFSPTYIRLFAFGAPQLTLAPPHMPIPHGLGRSAESLTRASRTREPAARPCLSRASELTSASQPPHSKRDNLPAHDIARQPIPTTQPALTHPHAPSQAHAPSRASLSLHVPQVTALVEAGAPLHAAHRNVARGCTPLLVAAALVSISAAAAPAGLPAVAGPGPGLRG